MDQPQTAFDAALAEIGTAVADEARAVDNHADGLWSKAKAAYAGGWPYWVPVVAGVALVAHKL